MSNKDTEGGLNGWGFNPLFPGASGGEEPARDPNTGGPWAEPDVFSSSLPQPIQEVVSGDLEQLDEAVLRLSQEGISLFGRDVPVGPQHVFADELDQRLWIDIGTVGVRSALGCYRAIDKALLSQEGYTQKARFDVSTLLGAVFKPAEEKTFNEVYGGVVRMVTTMRPDPDNPRRLLASFAVEKIAK